MKAMENKQKAIEKAYGFLNDMIDENGWAVYSIDEAGESGIEPLGDYEIQSEKDGVTVWRPKSLQGIETNNGWIKIESEDDLPKDDSVNYDMYNKNGRAISDLPLKTIIQLFKKCIITHYAIHVQRKPPIY